MHRQPLVHMTPDEGCSRRACLVRVRIRVRVRVRVSPDERVIAEGLASEPVGVLCGHLRGRRMVDPAFRQHAYSVLAHAIVGLEKLEAAHVHRATVYREHEADRTVERTVV
eukprot:scaffold55210_cov38-Phaeocystis_antarctica.AAC.2